MTTEEFIEKLAEVKMTFFITEHEAIRTREEVTVRYDDGEGSRRCLCPIEALWYHMSREREALCFGDAAKAMGLSRLDMWLIMDGADDRAYVDGQDNQWSTLRQSLLSTLTFEDAS